MTLDVDRFRRRLEADLSGLDEALAQAEASGGTVALDQSSVGRLSRMDALQQQAMALGLRERLAIRRRGVVAALTRITAGTYGQCCQCGSAIESERLESDPAAVFCSDCVTARATDGGTRRKG
jgi:DnaK suppressor protein